jgi:hypothetical protein
MNARWFAARLHRAEEHQTRPIVVGLTGREGETDWGVYNRVNCTAHFRD